MWCGVRWSRWAPRGARRLRGPVRGAGDGQKQSGHPGLTLRNRIVLFSSGKPLMILDEPTSNLDKKNTYELLVTLKKINRLKKITIIIVSHDKSVLEICDNIIKI